MSALHLHIETVFGEPDLVVLRTSTEPKESKVVMLVRLDALHDAVLTMLDALPVDDDAPRRYTESHNNE
ncbi:hypothetical protein R75461_07670 [Paraburkholderia nemoris]|uniref:hypothetical protein n=1 Tax=Paraburkholderia nemoris TaxID=2793076 RepID=UPI00190A069E|nr:MULTISPECIES: hypothetical protein [Paraburkholderia]MBK3786432.1 hypothetical protein [Paraburkholderia aspalathi]CAE6855199.1 hypothetical protein R75461_07670 [Paraburkholderia nemoris]